RRLSSALSPPSSFFLLLTPPPPTSTLFPYTTLFRSELSENTLFTEKLENLAGDSVGVVYASSMEETGQSPTQWFKKTSFWRLALDRKSTRLNSSHVSISYAVFCLKKKTTYHIYTNKI